MLLLPTKQRQNKPIGLVWFETLVQPYQSIQSAKSGVVRQTVVECGTRPLKGELGENILWSYGRVPTGNHILSKYVGR